MNYLVQCTRCKRTQWGRGHPDGYGVDLDLDSFEPAEWDPEEGSDCNHDCEWEVLDEEWPEPIPDDAI